MSGSNSRRKGRKAKKHVSSNFAPSPHITPAPEQPPLSRSGPLTEKEVRALHGGTDPRDPASFLAYGPTRLPFTYAWTDNRIEMVRHFKHWVYVAINKIASKIASQLPNVTYVRSSFDADTTKFLSPFARTRALVPLLTHEQLEPVPSDHPLPRLLSDPNEPDTSYDLWYETVLYRLLTGVAYWWVPRDALGLPAALWVIPSHWMWPVMGKERMIDGWEIRPVEGNYLRKVIPADEVIEFKGKNPVSKIDGFSTLTAVSQWADIQYATDRGKWHAYKNGTFPTVAVQFDGDMNDPTDQDLVRIEQKFLARYAGESRSNRPLFLPPGVQVKPLVIKPNEMMFGDTSREMRDNILAAFGVPVELIDLQGNTLHAESAFYNQTVNPLCHWLGCVLTEKLARRYPQDDGRIKIWYERFTADDPHLENENVKVDLLCGAVTPSERRISRGKQPYTGEWEKFGNSPIIPVNMEQGALPGGGEHEPGDNNDTPSSEQPLLNDDDYKSSRNGHVNRIFTSPTDQ